MGDYDVTIPEDTPYGTYKIRVGRFEDDTLFGCSGEFEITGTDDDDDDDSDSSSMSFTF